MVWHPRADPAWYSHNILLYVHIFWTEFCSFLFIKTEMNNMNMCVAHKNLYSICFLKWIFDQKFPFSIEMNMQYLKFRISLSIISIIFPITTNCDCIFIFEWKYFILKFSIRNWFLLLCILHESWMYPVSIHDAECNK